MMSDSIASSAAPVRSASDLRLGRRRLARLVGTHGPAAAVGLALGLLALGPGLARGFLLSYDMVFVPSPPFSAALLGLGGGPARAVPSDATITVAASVLPGDIVQKLILLLIFTAACAGAAALLAAGWRASRGTTQAPLLAGLVSGACYAWNPFVAERLLIGQWALLLGYAGLPWVLRELCTGQVKIRWGRLALAMLPAAIGGFAALIVTGLAVVPASLARGSGIERYRRFAIALGVLCVLSLPWLIPSALVPVHTDPAAVDLFAARADTPFGRLGSLALLSGIWNSQTVPRGYGGAGSFFWLLVVMSAVACYILLARSQRGWTGLGLAGGVGFVIAALGATSPTRAMLHGLVAAWPGFAVLRDGQQFVAALALLDAVGLGVGAARLLSIVRPSRTETPRAAREPAAVALAILAMLAPVVLLPGLAWGLAGRLQPVQYPADWLSARQIIDKSPQSGSVLVLPWAAYRRYSWNNSEAVYDPWTKLLSREVVSNDGLEVGEKTLTQESAASIKLSRIVTTRGPLTVLLMNAGVRFVVVDAGPLLDARSVRLSARDSLATRARLPGARVVLASHDLVIFQLPEGQRQKGMAR